jgi:hypothetical protein
MHKLKTVLMKKCILFFLVAVLLGLSNQLFAQARKFVLIEHFTSSTCAPCAAQNPFLQALLVVNRGSVQHIAYHVNWPSPGNDPMYAYNPTDINARKNYYGVNSVPDCFMEGNVYHGGPAGITQSMLNDVSTDPSPIRITVKETSNGVARTVVVKVFTLAEIPTGTYKLRAAVCEKLKHYSSPPGTNGERDFPDVFRKGLPNSTGDTYTPAAIGDSVVFTYNYNLDMATWDTTQIYTIAYVQNESTKEVVNSGSSITAGWELVPLDACFYKGTPGESKPFHYQVMNLRDTPVDFKVKVTSEQPADWGISFVINSVTYNDSTIITVPAKATYDMLVNVDIGSTKALGTYFISLSEIGSTSYDAQTLNAYIISGIYELIVNNDGSWGDGTGTNAADFQQNYVKGLELAGSDYFAVTGLAALLKAGKSNSLTGVNNYYFNIGWSFPALTDNTVALLTSELNLGKNLFLSGQDIGWDVWTIPDDGGHSTANTKAFYTNILNAQFLNDGVAGDNQLVPEATDSVFGLLSTSSLSAVYGTNYFFPDEINAIGIGTNVFYYNAGKTKNAGVRATNGTWKIVYLAPSLEMVTDTNVRKEIIKNSHDWFGGPSTGITSHSSSKQSYLGQNYPNPANGTTTMLLTGITTDMTLEIIDLTGRTMKSVNVSGGSIQITLNTGSLNNGTYLYQLKNGTRVLETKIMQVIH